MAAKLTFKDVLEGRAVPQRGDMVGPYVYTGGDPSDLSLYQPQAQDGFTPPPLSGSIYDPKNFTAQSVQGGAPVSPAFDRPPSNGSVTFAATRDDAGNPARYPGADWQPPGSRSLVDSDYARNLLTDRIAADGSQSGQKQLNRLKFMPSPLAAPILGVIRNGESFGDANGNGADYNAVGHRPKGKSGQDFSTMTVRQVLDWQANNGKHAVGAYQFEHPTLSRIAGDLIDEPFDQPTQDALAARMLKSRGLNDYLNGRIDKAQFMRQLSGTWRSLPSDMTGAPYDPNDKNNRVLVPAQAVSDALDSGQ